MKTAAEYLKGSYERVLLPDEESGTFTALIRELPGCVAQGDTPAEAYANLEDAAESWIEAALDLGQDIPEPRSEESYSGRVLLRLPRSVHREATEAAERDGTSLNQFILTAVAQRLGATHAHSTHRASPQWPVGQVQQVYALHFTQPARLRGGEWPASAQNIVYVAEQKISNPARGANLLVVARPEKRERSYV